MKNKLSTINWALLAICIAIPLAVGFVSGFISGDSMESFNALQKPPLSPPDWIFPVVWSILYILMGISSYLILVADVPKEQKQSALKTYVAQLVLNFSWSIIFFNFSLYYAAFVWILVLITLVIILIIQASPISKLASYLLIPYLLWLCFAAYLNLGIALIN